MYLIKKKRNSYQPQYNLKIFDLGGALNVIDNDYKLQIMTTNFPKIPLAERSKKFLLLISGLTF